MKVQCKLQRGGPIPADLLQAGNTSESVFHLTFGRVYVVYAIALWKDTLLYLVVEDNSIRPDWNHASIFDVVDRRIPTCWQYNHWHPRDENHLVPQQDLVAIWGYPELVDDSGENYVNLIEREQEALSAFFRRRAEIDEELDFL